MEPTLHEGDRVLVRYGVPTRPGTLVLVQVGGERPYVKRAWREVPEGWWVERDNPRAGEDSWSFGPVPEQRVLGRVVGRLWPRPSRFPPRS
jgi:phage repressor protein C with HTH and peptisase S24 domain